jgi:hypothetical protein
MLSDSPVSIVDEDIRETVHEINNFIHTETWLKLFRNIDIYRRTSEETYSWSSLSSPL